MRATTRAVGPILAAVMAGSWGCATGPGKQEEQSYPVVDGLLDPYAQATALGKGVNFGNLLDAYPDEGAWIGGQHIQASDFDLAKAAGFASVRLPVRFSDHASKVAPYTIDAAFMARVDEVVGWGLSRGLRVVLDLHHYTELHEDPAAHRARFVALWQQIATHFKDAPDGLYLELLNEPSDRLTVEVWNGVLLEALQAIRAIDPHHTVVVGCTSWSNPEGLDGLRLPSRETNAIVTFHYYAPTLFCFQGKDWQGASWATTGITWPGPPAAPVTPAAGVEQWARDWIQQYNTLPAATNPGGEAFVRSELAAAAAWGLANHRPLWMGEFTAQDGADLASRARWERFVRTELERHGIPWSIWTLDSDTGSKLYDLGTGRWTLELTEALGLGVTNP
jgi:endoglucanase